MSEKRIEIGYIQKAHGIKGEVFLKLYEEGAEFLKPHLELYLKEEKFTLVQARKVPQGFILKLKEIATRNESELLKASKVYVEGSLFENEKEGFYLNQVLGFDILFKNEVKGQVVGFGLTEAHDLLRVRLLGSQDEVEIPYVDHFIKNINKLEKNIEVDCPEELFDLEFFNEAKK